MVETDLVCAGGLRESLEDQLDGVLGLAAQDGAECWIVELLFATDV